jgi:hypothetical protein
VTGVLWQELCVSAKLCKHRGWRLTRDGAAQGGKRKSGAGTVTPSAAAPPLKKHKRG